MSKIPRKSVFLDERAIGDARTIDEAIRALRIYAIRSHPTAALRALLISLGVEHPEHWRARQHLSEGPDAFYFHVRTLKGDTP